VKDNLIGQLLLVAWTTLVSIGCLWADLPAETPDSIFAAETLTQGYWGLNDILNNQGVDVSLSATSIYQQNVRGGLRTSDRSGRLTGSHDFEITLDLERILGLTGASVYIHNEGGWPDAEGINEQSVGSFWGTNDDAADYGSILVTEFWYEQRLCDDKLLIRLGKMDLTCGIDCQERPVAFGHNTYACNENTQFLNSALVNDLAIPFPDYGVGIMAGYFPTENWYVSVGAADAQANIREAGFDSAFHNRDYYFYIFETGFLPRFNLGGAELPGAYRMGVWLDPQDKDRLNGPGSQRDDTGFYLSFDQLLYRENAVAADEQGLGGFARFGWADDDLNEITNFWSLGLQYQGLFPGRDGDVLACGMAQAIFSDHAEFTEDAETIVETYYNIYLTGWLQVTPAVQYIADPSADPAAKDALVLGIRTMVSF